MKKDIKLPSLRRVDAATAKKIQELYPADWDMDAVFRKSYQKYQQSGAAGSEGMYGSQTDTTRQKKIHLHINRYVTAACLLLTAGIAGFVGYMQLSVAEPPVILPDDPAATTAPLLEVLPDDTTADTDAEMTDTLSEADHGTHDTTETQTVQQAGSDAQHTASSPSETEAGAEETEQDAPPQTDDNAAVTTSKQSSTTSKNQHTTATTARTTSPKITTAKTTTAPKSTTTTGKRTTSPPMVTTTVDMTIPAGTTTAPNWAYTTNQTAAAEPVETTSATAVEGGAVPPEGTDEPSLPSTGENPVDESNEYGFSFHQSPYQNNEYVISYRFEDTNHYYFPYFRVDLSGYDTTVIYPEDYGSSLSYVTNEETGARFYVDFFSGYEFSVTFSYTNSYCEEVYVGGEIAYLVTRDDVAELIWFDGRYVCTMYTAPENSGELIAIAEHMISH